MLILRDDENFISTGAGTTVATDKPFSIPLHPRWNVFGNPFNFAIPVDHIRTMNGETPVLRFFGDEDNEDLVSAAWNDPVNDEVEEIEPFEGYAVFNHSSEIDTL